MTFIFERMVFFMSNIFINRHNVYTAFDIQTVKIQTQYIDLHFPWNNHQQPNLAPLDSGNNCAYYIVKFYNVLKFNNTMHTVNSNNF